MEHFIVIKYINICIKQYRYSIHVHWIVRTYYYALFPFWNFIFKNYLEVLFNEIAEKSNRKEIVSLSKKLAKKLSFKSGKDVENLCHLAYWLYITGDRENAEKCIALTHDVPFDGKYDVWDFINNIWGVEIRILREKGKNILADEIIHEMDKQLKMPLKIETAEKALIRENKRRERFTVEGQSNKNEIEKCLKENNIKSANEYRFIGIITLIGRTETGLYPHLNAEKEKIEKIIKEYVAEILK